MAMATGMARAVGAADVDGDGAGVGGAVGADVARGFACGPVVAGVELGIEDIGAEVLADGVGYDAKSVFNTDRALGHGRLVVPSHAATRHSAGRAVCRTQR